MFVTKRTVFYGYLSCIALSPCACHSTGVVLVDGSITGSAGLWIWIWIYDRVLVYSLRGLGGSSALRKDLIASASDIDLGVNMKLLTAQLSAAVRNCAS